MKVFFLIFRYKTKKSRFYAGLNKNGHPKTVTDFKKAFLYKTQKALENSLENYINHKTSPLINLSSEIISLDIKTKDENK